MVEPSHCTHKLPAVVWSLLYNKIKKNSVDSVFPRKPPRRRARRQQQNERKKKQEGKVDFLIPFLLFFYRPTRPNGKKRNTEKNDYSFPSKIENNGGKSSFFFQVYLFIPVFLFSHWMLLLRDRYAAAPVWLSVYIFQERHQREKGVPKAEKEIGRSCLSFRDTAKREKFCVMWKYFGTNIIQSFSFFPFRLLRLYSTGRLLRWNTLFLAMCLCIHETKCLSKREKANQIGNHCTHTHTERKKKISFLRVLSVDTQSVASTTSSIRRLGKASQRYKSTSSSSFP